MSDNIDFDPRSREFHADPWRVYRELREHQPAYWSERYSFWALSHFEDVRSALFEGETYSNEGGVVAGEGSFFKPFLLIMDPPYHTRLRQLMVDILTPKRFSALEPVIRSTCVELLESGLRDGAIDLATDFAARLPMFIIGRLLGVPRDMDQQLISWGHAIGNIDPDNAAESGRRAVEETLRFDSPTYLETRTLKQDVELHGQTLKAGEQVALLFNSANHDERQFDDPDTYDIYRKLKVTDHLAFGGGVHACIGVQLARLEARVAFEEIFRLLGDYTLQRDGAQHTYSTNQRGWLKLPVLAAGQGVAA